MIRHVGEQSLLILLDNCEHLVDACAAIALALLQRVSEPADHRHQQAVAPDPG